MSLPRLRGVAKMPTAKHDSPQMRLHTVSGSSAHLGSRGARMENVVMQSGVHATRRRRRASHARCSATRGGITRSEPQQHEQHSVFTRVPAAAAWTMKPKIRVASYDINRPLGGRHEEEQEHQREGREEDEEKDADHSDRLRHVRPRREEHDRQRHNHQRVVKMNAAAALDGPHAALHHGPFGINVGKYDRGEELEEEERPPQLEEAAGHAELDARRSVGGGEL